METGVTLFLEDKFQRGKMIYLTSAPCYSVVEPFLQFIPTAMSGNNTHISRISNCFTSAELYQLHNRSKLHNERRYCHIEHRYRCTGIERRYWCIKQWVFHDVSQCFTSVSWCVTCVSRCFTNHQAPEHGRVVRKNKLQHRAKQKKPAWNSFSYICTRALHSIWSSARHWHAASTVIPL